MPPEYGHINRHFNFGKYLYRLGYKPTVLSGSHLFNSDTKLIMDGSIGKKYKNCDFPYFFIRTCDHSGSRGKRVYAMLEFYRNIFRFTRGMNKPDVIIGSSPSPLSAVAAINLSKKYGCQSIVEIRDLWPESFVAFNVIKNNTILRPLYAGEQWIYKKADKLIFTMEGGKDYIIEKGWDKEQGGPIDINKAYHVNNGVDMEVFDYNRDNFVLEDNDLMDENYFKVVYAGSIRLANNVGKIIDVAKQLEGQNIKFLVWGDGYELEYLKKRVRDEQLNNICFKGNVEKKYIPYIITKSHLTVSFGENISLFRFGLSKNKLFDYFASGKPTLLTYKTGYSLVEKYKAGIELDDCRAETIAESILYFKNLNKAAYNDYCENARKAAEDYSFARLTNSLINVIEA